MALISKASLLMVPSTYEQEKLYNVLPSGNRAPDSTDQNSGYDQTRADFTFDRGSNAAATRIDENGVLQKYRENVLTESNNFSDSDWDLASITLTSGQTGYDGSNDAWIASKNAATTYRYISQLVSKSGVQTASVYAKAGTLSAIALYCGGGTNPYVYFNLSTGVIVGQRSSVIDSSINDVGEGWYHLTMTFNESITFFQIYPDWNLTNTGTIYIQNAQLESGMVSTDYLDSGATTAKAGVLIDLPRINYDANGENGSLLLEPSRQQLIQHSEYFGAWNTNGTASVSDNQAVSPEGVQNAALLDFGSTTLGANRIDLEPSISAGTDYVFSVFAKNIDANRIGIRNYNSTKDAIANFDFSSGSFTDTNVNVIDTIVEPYDNDWYRIGIVFNSGVDTTADVRISPDTTSGSDGEQVYIYGAQLEAGSYATSYIPNHGESGGVTRAADSCNGSEDSSLFNDSAMSLFLDLPSTGQETGIKEITISDGTADNRFNIYAVTSNQLRTSLVSGGSVILNYVVSDITTNQNLKILISYSGSTYKVFVNGELELNTTMPTPPTGLNVFDFSNATGSSLFYGKVKQAAVFTEALTDAEAITLTTL